MAPFPGVLCDEPHEAEGIASGIVHKFAADEDEIPVLTERQEMVLTIIQGSQLRPLTATDIGRRMGFDAGEASPLVAKALRKLVACGMITRHEQNRRVITYSRDDFAMPRYRRAPRGRKLTKGFEIKRVFKGGTTMLDTGLEVQPIASRALHGEVAAFQSVVTKD